MARRRHLIACILAAVASLFTSATMGQDRITPRPVLIFLDDLHIEFQNTPKLRTGFLRATERLLAAGRTVAIVSDGSSSVSIRPTNDATALSQIANRISGGGLKPSETTSPTPDITAEMKRRVAIAGETLQSVLRVEGLEAILYVTEGQTEPKSAGIPILMTRPEGMEAAVAELLSR